MKKFAFISCGLILAACGGGGTSSGPSTMATVPSTPQGQVIKSNQVVTGMTSFIDNGEKRTDYVLNALGPDYFPEDMWNGRTIVITRGASGDAMAAPGVTRGVTTGAGACRSVTECSQMAFDNMLEQLADNKIDPDTVTDTDQLRQALAMIGYSDALDADWTDVHAYIVDNLEHLSDMATNVYSQYRDFNLGDVAFTMASASNGDRAGAKDLITFDVKDNGEIGGIHLWTYRSDDGTLVPVPGADVVATRVNWDNLFTVSQTREQDDGSVVNVSGAVSVDTYGRDFDLTYSDFGLLTGNITTTTTGPDGAENTVVQKQYEPFAGGYTNKEIAYNDIKNIETEYVFNNGRAIGSVKARDGSDDLSLRGTANLRFHVDDTGPTETLNMKFSNWYNVTIVKDADNADIQFSANGAQIKDVYRFTSADANDGEFSTSDFLNGDYNGTIVTDNNAPYGKLDIKYYGDDNRPTEATGVMKYINEGIEANIAFGVK